MNSELFDELDTDWDASQVSFNPDQYALMKTKVRRTKPLWQKIEELKDEKDLQKSLYDFDYDEH
jgi:hypothetical protein